VKDSSSNQSIVSDFSGKAATQLVPLKQTTIELDCIPHFSESEVNTDSVETYSKGVSHTDGAWPKDVDPKYVESVMRYKKKVERELGFGVFVNKAVELSEKYIRQNTALDIYEQYFDGETYHQQSEQPSAQNICIFKDPQGEKGGRHATSISWEASGTLFGVSYCVMSFAAAQPSLESYVWNVENQSKPHLELCPPSPLSTLCFNPHTVSTLAGGMYNGLIAMWDIRVGGLPHSTSIIETSHSDPVYEIHWCQSKAGMECISVSTDGSVMWWDTRRLSDPVDSIKLQKTNKFSGGTCMAYNSSAGATKILLGTEQGQIVGCNRKAKNDRVTHIYPAHNGPVQAVERNHFFPSYFLSVGDWTAQIWHEDVSTPILISPPNDHLLTTACWNPSRPGVFYTGDSHGNLQVWDIVDRYMEPIFSHAVSETALCSIAIEKKGMLVAVGDKGGTLTLLQTSQPLYTLQSDEKEAVSNLLDVGKASQKCLRPE